MSENERLTILKDILLSDEREQNELIIEKIKELEESIYLKEKLSKRLNPIIKTHLKDYTQEIPNTMGPIITKALDVQIKRSREVVIEALYPIMGKMIKKFIAQELKMLTEQIQGQLAKNLSLGSWLKRAKLWLGGVEEEKYIMSVLSKVNIEEVLIIEKDSGLLIGSLSKSDTIDKDMISGMLTAIKNFVEDAFNTKEQKLESIEYELYNIHIQNFISFYVAVVLSGNYTTAAKNDLQDLIFDFSDSFLSLPGRTSFTAEIIEKELAYYFDDDNL